MKPVIPLLLAVVAVGGVAQAREITVAANYGAFVPVSSATRGAFASSFSRLSFSTFEPTKPTKNHIIFETGNYDLSGDKRVRLIPLTVGVEKGMKTRGVVQPYTVLRVGPYYGKVDDFTTLESDSKWGLSGSAALGVVYKKKFYVEGRYDYFSPLAGYKFDGLSVSAGMKLFNFKI